MVFSRKREIIAVVIGIALAGVPMVAFNLWFQGLIERHGREEVAEIAYRSLAMAEGRLTRVIDALAELAGRGVDSCKPAHVEALRQANFSIPPIKELAIVDAAGQTLCTDLAIPLGIRRVVSSHLLTPEGDFLIEVVNLGDHQGSTIRIRRSGNTNAIAALVPAELLLPLSDLTASHALAVTTREGAMLSRGGDARKVANGEHFATSLHSPRYHLAATAAVSRAPISDHYGHLQVVGPLIAGTLGLVVAGLGFALPARRRNDPEREIQRALKAGEFVPYFQPIVDIATGKLLGAEVLIRRRRPDGSLVLPSTFIPLLESRGLIGEVTRFLMRRVLDDVGTIYANRPRLHISFNLAAAHFADESIVRDVQEIFQGSPIRFSQVVLEVTERQPLENLTETRRIIAALQGLGIIIAIDDVGSGHSGLSYLLKLGVDLIKIDKIFVDAIGTDRNSMTIIETLIDLARNMRMDIVAEGVENFEQVVLLRDLGIRAAQGYVFAPPLPASSFVQLVATIDPVASEQENTPALEGIKVTAA